MVARHVLVIAVLTGTAAAEQTFTHSAHVTVNVSLTERAKPAAKHDEVAQPGLTADDALHIEQLLGGVREEQAQILRELIEKTPDTDVDEKAEDYFRLGEIYAKQHREHHLLAIQAELAAGHEHDPDKQAKLTKTATSEAAEARARLVDAVKIYKALTDDERYRNYGNLDTALFYLGYTLQTGGFAKEARAAFAKLLENYPTSRFVPEAHLAFGERAFETGQLADAEARYRDVLKFPRSSVYWYAFYKLGWVQLNLGKAQDALATFYQVAEGTRTGSDLLHRAAKHDFVRAYAEIGRADKALPAFQRVDKADALGMLATLGDTYLDQGKSDKAIFVFRQLITQQPRSPEVCAWQFDVARAMLSIGTTNDKVHEIEQLVKLYAALHAHLPKAQASDCHDAAAEMSGELARAYHQEAEKTKNVELLGYSDRLYRAYLGAFRDAKDFGETQYFHAELSWLRAEMERVAPQLATQHWEAAAKAFTEVVETGAVDAHLIQVSADAAMLAWMKALAVDPHTRPAPPDDTAYTTIPQPRPLPEREQKLLAAYDGYLAHVKDPKDAERVDVQFLKADLLRRFDHLTEATALFQDLLAHHKDHESAESAAQLALDSLNRLQRYPEMLAMARGLLADTGFLEGKDGLKTTLQKVQRQSLRKEAERLETEGKKTHRLAAFVECAQKYIEVYNLAAGEPEADVLLYNGGVCFEEGKSLAAARKLYEMLQKLYPSSKLAAKSIVRLGNAYAQTAYYREASESFEGYAAKFAGEKESYDALSDAVVFRRGIGDDAKAIEDTTTFIRLYGKTHPADAATAFWSLTAIYEKQGDLDQLARHLRLYLERYAAIGGSDRVVIAWSKIGQALWQRACPIAAVDGACARVTREAAFGMRVRHAKSEIRHQCGDDSKIKLTMVARDSAKATAAMSAFANAIAAFDKEQVTGDKRGALYYYGLAKIGRADREYEELLALQIPVGLDFDVHNAAMAARSKQRFETWFAKKRGLAETLFAEYDAIIKLNDGPTAITSAARRGQVAQSFAGQLFRAEIPATLRTGPYAADAIDSYCDALTAVAEPLETLALQSYQGCLVTSTKLGWFSESSRLCERELGQLRPELWPTTSELRKSPDQVSTIQDTEGLVD